MSDVNAAPNGEVAPTGGDNPELPNADTANPGADQGNANPADPAAADPAPADPAPTDSPAKPDDPVNKRFSEVTKQRDEAVRREREAREQLGTALEALNRATGGKKPDETTKTPPADDPEPEPPEFIDPEQYQRDMAEYTRKVTDRTVKMQLRTERANQEREAAEQKTREEAVEHGRAWMTRRAKAMEEMPDYADVAENNDLHISQTMVVAITSSENGPKVAYYLGQHPELAERISKMKPAMQLMEMGKLEAQITAPKPPKTSKAPEPITIKTGSGEPQSKSLDDLSMEEYAAQRAKRH